MTSQPTGLSALLIQTYQKVLLHPALTLILVAMISAVAIWQTRHFSFDASTDTLVVEGDPRVETYLEMNQIFGGDEFLVLTWEPKDDLFAPDNLAHLAELQALVDQLPGVRDTFSILDAPLTQSPPVPLEDLAEGYKTLANPAVDRSMARQELTTSPLFEDFLISSDGSASIIRIDLERPAALQEASTALKAAKQQGNPEEVEKLEAELSAVRQAFLDDRAALIQDLKDIRARFSDRATIYMSGVPMIASEMITYVKADLINFGGLVLCAIIMSLYFFFRRVRWVFLPLGISGLSILWTAGMLGWMGTPVTVVSSNFIALLAIICISFSIHLIVRYRELLTEDEYEQHIDLVTETMQSKFQPCLYTALTTILAFGSMTGSGIVPVEDFGWMMCLGILLSFTVTYLVFPAALLLLGKGEPSKTLNRQIALTNTLSDFTRNRPTTILGLGVLIGAIASYGLTLVSFDNRFVEYFDEDTDIHQGMVYIDEKLGGTMPFDVYIKFEAYSNESSGDGFGGFDDFGTPDDYPEKYWFTLNKLDTIAALHEFVVDRPETGKVISLNTLDRLAANLNEGERLGPTELTFVIDNLPATIRAQIIEPYARPNEGLARINGRIQQTGDAMMAGSGRADLVPAIRQFAEKELAIPASDVTVTGMMVLFDDMLRQLADSQLKTLGYVLGATFLMFSMLLRSIRLATIALVPNILAAASVVAFMGYASVPLDMMTITIAAICIGIGVDDAVHYLHRFREEFDEGKSVTESVRLAHATIGRAMYFTTLIIAIGFSILAMSSFMPTVYFGVLTALAMIFALIANLTLLPALLIKCLPDRSTEQVS